MLHDIEGVIERAKEKGVDAIVNICTDSSSLKKGLELADRFPMIFNTAATTPHDVEKEGEEFFPLVRQHLLKLVAIGETGLDYYYEHSKKKIQQDFLIRYAELARDADLPLVFHCRDAFEDLFAIMDQMGGDNAAVLHCFTGTKEEARGCLDRGWFISFSGIITFKKSEELRKVVSYVPLDYMFIETDAPYLAPQSHRGKQNEPAYMVETAQTIAAIKEVSLKEIEQATTKNISRFFRIKEIG